MIPTELHESSIEAVKSDVNKYLDYLANRVKYFDNLPVEKTSQKDIERTEALRNFVTNVLYMQKAYQEYVDFLQQGFQSQSKLSDLAKLFNSRMAAMLKYVGNKDPALLLEAHKANDPLTDVILTTKQKIPKLTDGKKEN